MVAARGLDAVDLVTHDMGDSVGGAMLARDLEAGPDGGGLPFRVRRRVVSNGSGYLSMADLTVGQRLAAWLPDRQLPRVATPLVKAMVTHGIAGLFGDRPITTEDAHALWALMAQDDGHLVLPRLVRYLDDRREHEVRWTAAIVAHPAPLRVVWGAADPVAVVGMAHRLVGERRDAALDVLAGVGHVPMLEAPDTFAAAVLAGLRDEAVPDRSST